MNKGGGILSTPLSLVRLSGDWTEGIRPQNTTESNSLGLLLYFANHEAFGAGVRFWVELLGVF